MGQRGALGRGRQGNLGWCSSQGGRKRQALRMGTTAGSLSGQHARGYPEPPGTSSASQSGRAS